MPFRPRAPPATFLLTRPLLRPSPHSFRQLCVMQTAPSSQPTTSVSTALQTVLSRVSSACTSCNRSPIQLVAVSKTKPASMIQEAYDAGHRRFGENYVQELVNKAPDLPKDITWHFIGALQSNKAKLLVSVKNLDVVESVDRRKVAAALNKAVKMRESGGKLKVMVQVNTSGEESKAGCKPGESVELAKFVEEECDGLELVGLMTIGAPDDSEEPVAFKVLAEEREDVESKLGREKGSLILSMGMSGDFERAIKMGSDSVRVGSTIFGAREYR